MFVTTLLLYGVRTCHYHGLLVQKNGYYGKYSTAFLNTNSYDLLFLGSSRVQMHFNSRMFTDSTGISSFNLSMAGATPKVALAALRIYLAKSKAPKEIIYDIDYHNIHLESKEIKDFNNYFPYLKDATVRNEFAKIDKRMTYFYTIPYYSLPYTGFKNLSTGLHGWLNTPNKTDSLFDEGYFKETLRPYLTFTFVKPQNILPVPIELNCLDSIIDICAKKTIQFTCVSSPIFAGGVLDVANKKELIGILSEHLKAKGVRYIDMSSLPFCNQRELFVDHFHMNYKGSTLFTAYFTDFYSNNLQKNAFKH